jgi:hypothetical protein
MKECWWGMLATRPERRGQRLSLILGAAVLIGMHERWGFERFFTGIATGNAPSMAVCSRIGLAPSQYATVIATDPDLVPGGRMTK